MKLDEKDLSHLKLVVEAVILAGKYHGCCISGTDVEAAKSLQQKFKEE